jgi:hypothetical protein
MDCEKVRDRFSSLWEKELTPVEKKTVEEHLSSCPACRREFEQFEKTMQWLHSAGEVEVPDGFLPGLLKKMEERKRMPPDQKATERRFHFPLSFKLPAQAVAMVAIVFLVLYLTKMMPMEKYHLEKTEETPSSLSLKEKSEHSLAEKEGERARVALETPSEAPRPKDLEQAKAPIPKEGQLEETSAPKPKAEAKKREAPVQSTEVLGYQAVESKEAGRAKAPSPEPEKVERELAGLGKPLVAPKPHQEIVLRTSDRERAISQLHELVKQFGGEIVTKEESALIVSFPRSSFSEFEKELGELSASTRAGKVLAFMRRSDTGDLSVSQRVMKEEIDKKSKETTTLADDAAYRTIVRILLIQE